MTRRAAALPLVLLAFALPIGCGGDDESPGDTTATERTVPQTDEQVTTSQTSTGGSTSTSPPSDTSGGSPAPAPKTEPEDSPKNDVPPPADSPAERFERECEKNPDACG
jgi:hypothetical protein